MPKLTVNCLCGEVHEVDYEGIFCKLPCGNYVVELQDCVEGESPYMIVEDWESLISQLFDQVQD